MNLRYRWLGMNDRHKGMTFGVIFMIWCICFGAFAIYTECEWALVLQTVGFVCAAAIFLGSYFQPDEKPND